jgi:uncharacterized membrane protein YraQ (UPF0718 family)
MDQFLIIFFSYAGSILPWVVIGSAVSYVVDRAVDVKLIHRVLGKINLRSIFTAQILGMVSPLSIMSALPITGELVRLGAQPLMLVSFLIAERAYDLQSFFIISNLFGMKIAILNALVIFISLVSTAWIFRKEKMKMSGQNGKKSGNFWKDQLRTLLVVLLGITIGALLRIAIPLTGFGHIMSSWLGGLLTGLTLGFGLYFGTILGNYPVAKSLADLGMAPVGTMVFLSVSPIFNLVIILLFFSAVKPKYIAKMIGIYTLISLILSIIVSGFIP